MAAAFDIAQWCGAELVRAGASSVYEQLLEQDARLVAAGFPPLSPWWRGALERCYATSKRRMVLRVGRRGGKSSSLCRVAVAEVLYGPHSVPPGDLGVFAFVSTKKSEAAERLNTIAQILDALSIGYDRAGDTIRPHGLNRAWRVYAANYRTAVGMTLIGLVADEVARWRDDDTGANPATEVLRSMRPAMATQRHAREFLSSSPFAQLDAHYEAFAAGETAEQSVAAAPSWIANPTITEARCRELEPDEPTFRREYGAEPMPNSEATFFDGRELDAAVARHLAGEDGTQPGDVLTAGADLAFRSDSSALAVVRRRGSVLRPLELVELRPGETALRPSDTIEAFAHALARHGVPTVMADEHYAQSLVEHLEAFGLRRIPAPHDVPATYVHARTLLHQGALELPDHRQLLRDLREVTATPTAAGRISIRLPRRVGGGHADLVSALVLAIWQRAGHVVPDPYADLQNGWTRVELDDVERMLSRRRADRGDCLFADGDTYQ